MINPGYRLLAAGALALAIAGAVPAVSSAAPREVTVEKLASVVDDALRERPQFKDLWQVTCNGALEAIVGATQRCTAVKIGGARFAVDVRVTAVQPTSLEWNYRITPQP